MLAKHCKMSGGTDTGWSEALVHEIFDKYAIYSTNMDYVSLRGFQKFLTVEQMDPMGNDEEKATQFMRHFLREHDPSRTEQELFFKQSEFLEMLYSKQNSIWDSKHDQVTQDMSRPLSHYWISTSQNTFLNDDQNSSALYLDAYARCLRAGCRCIDLDCWDGPDGVPVICNGHTLTARLNLLDVLHTIKDNAFATSDYPLILSIEANCSVPQQRNLAKALIRVFGDLLQSNSLNKKETKITTPSLLRRKIILKHINLQEEENAEAYEDRPLRLTASKWSGVMYMEKPSDNQNPGPIPSLAEWNAHKMDLTFSRMLRFEQFTRSDIENFGDNQDIVMETAVEVPQDGTHFGEIWFHGKLEGSREEAEQLLLEHSYLGDGTFLVRESNTFAGDYCLSFLRQGVVGHCRIQQKRDAQYTKYYYDDELTFDSLYDLVSYYRRNPMYTEEYTLQLKVPVPRLNKHEAKEWYHPDTTREQAENILKDILTNGAFLVRPGDRDRDTFVISFRCKEKVKHCKIAVDSRMYRIRTVLFESLVGLVEFYRIFYMHCTTRLTQPIVYVKRITANAIFEFDGQSDDDLTFKAGASITNVSRCNQNWWRGDCDGKRQGWFPANRVSVDTQPLCPKKKSSEDSLADYIEPKFFSSKITVKALYKYRAREMNDLSFDAGAIITNVDKRDRGWWRGDYGGKHYGSFPANYVKEIKRANISRKEKNDEVADSALQNGSVDVTGAVVRLVEGTDAGSPRWVLQIQAPTMCTPFEMAAPSRKIALEWVAALREDGESSSKSARGVNESTSRVLVNTPDHTVYCSSFNFSKARIGGKGFTFQGMSSFIETKATKMIRQRDNTVFFKYHRMQLLCVNPHRGQKIATSNFNPMPFWMSGSQLVALNYNMGDKPMQMNMAKFRENGGCGYVLKPDFMFEDDYNPTTLKPMNKKRKRVSVMLRVIGARHLSKLGAVNPFVEVEIMGAERHNGIKLVTEPVANDDFKLVWNKMASFDVSDLEGTIIRFHVQDGNSSNAPRFLGQATFPLNCLRTGYRSVPLCNEFSEEHETSTLFVHLALNHMQF